MMPRPEMNEAAGTAIPTASMNPNTHEGKFPMNMIANSEAFNGLVSETLKTTSRIVAEKFEKNHRDVLRAIRDLIEGNKEWGMRNFAQTPYVDPQNGQTYQMYEMTRDGYSMLVMGFTGKKAMDWKIKFLAAFNAMEEHLRATPAMLSGPQLMAAALIEADATMKAQAEQIESMQEDVAAHTRLSKAEGSLNITEAAKNLGMRPNELFDWLSHNGWIYKRPGSSNWLGYAPRCNSGDLWHKSTTVLRADGSERISEQVRVTPQGLAKLAKLIFPTAKLIGDAS